MEDTREKRGREKSQKKQRYQKIDSARMEGGDGRVNVLNPKGVSFDLNTSYCVYSVIEKKRRLDARGAAFGTEVD